MISIILPNLNGAKRLESAIKSFVYQEGHVESELLIVDNKSTDGSHQIIKSFAESHRNIHWIKETDKGISDALNLGVRSAKGELIGYLGNDDLLMPRITRTIAEFDKLIEFDVIFFNSYTNYVQERKCILQKPVTTLLSRENLLRHGTIVGLQNIYFRRRIFEGTRYNIENKYSMDYEMLLEISSQQLKTVYVDEVATINNMDGNITHNNPLQTIETINVSARFCKDYSGVLWFENLVDEPTLRRIRTHQ